MEVGGEVLTHGCDPGLRSLLLQAIGHGGDLDARDALYGGTPLYWATVNSGTGFSNAPNPDWVATAQALIDAGAALDDALLDYTFPSPQVAEILSRLGVTDHDGSGEGPTA